MHALRRLIQCGILLCASLGGSDAPARVRTDDPTVFLCRELLGRPTDRSITLNLSVDRDADVYVEYGRIPGVYDAHTEPQPLQPVQPVTILIAPLEADTRFHYRVRYRARGVQEYAVREEHTFQTARPRGRAFRFAIEADPHLDEATNQDLYALTLGNILAGGNDFLIDLGDTFMSDKLPVIDSASILARHLLFRSYFERICHSMPLFLVIGNHEGECGWYLNGTPGSLANRASATRMMYFPNPVPGSFYSGDTTRNVWIGARENAYAWEWGNALFVVLDPYWYTARKPGPSTDNWGWTLGKNQYEWFRTVLQGSGARFKFVFAHQVVGGLDAEGRGGIEAAPFYEMGGNNADGTWGFDTHRPGWELPLHQLMVRSGVTAFFHGHDHVFVHQALDGVAYQELPQPGYYNFTSPDKSYSNSGIAAKYGYTHGTVLSSSGYVRVTVEDTAAHVEYVRSYLPQHENAMRHNGDVAYSYILRPSGSATSVPDPGTVPGDCFLEPNYPNPFNPETTLSFHTGQAGHVQLDVVNILGITVRKVIDAQMSAGNHAIRFDGTGLASGVYCIVLRAGGSLSTRTMVYQK